MTTPLWQKDPSAEPATDDWVHRFTVGDDYEWDRLLLPYDAEASRAHAWGLHRIDVLSGDEFARIDEALDALLDAVKAGEALALAFSKSHLSSRSRPRFIRMIACSLASSAVRGRGLARWRPPGHSA